MYVISLTMSAFISLVNENLLVYMDFFLQNNNISAATTMNSRLIYIYYMIEINLSKRGTQNKDNIKGNIIQGFLVIKCLGKGKFWWRKRILNITVFYFSDLIFLNHNLLHNFIALKKNAENLKHVQFCANQNSQNTSSKQNNSKVRLTTSLTHQVSRHQTYHLHTQ